MGVQNGALKEEKKKKTGMNTARLRAVRKRVINNIKAQREMR